MMNKILAVMALTMTAYASTVRSTEPIDISLSPISNGCSWKSTIGKHWEQGIQDRFQANKGTNPEEKCTEKLKSPFHILTINGVGSKAQIPAYVI